MKNILREYIRELLRSIIKRPKQNEIISLGGGAITGHVGAQGDKDKNLKKDLKDDKDDVTCKSFGGGSYKEKESWALRI